MSTYHSSQWRKPYEKALRAFMRNEDDERLGVAYLLGGHMLEGQDEYLHVQGDYEKQIESDLVEGGLGPEDETLLIGIEVGHRDASLMVHVRSKNEWFNLGVLKAHMSTTFPGGIAGGTIDKVSVRFDHARPDPTGKPVPRGPGYVRIVYKVKRVVRQVRYAEAMRSPEVGTDMTLRIDEKHAITRAELHALLRGRPLIWNGKSNQGGNVFQARMTMSLGNDVSQGERQAALDALTNDVPTMYRGGFAINPRGEAYPVVGSTAWLAYVATNADRILWNGLPLAEQSETEQRKAIESWLANEQVPPLMAAKTAMRIAEDGGPHVTSLIPIYREGGEGAEHVPNVGPMSRVLASIDDDRKMSAEGESAAPTDPAERDRSSVETGTHAVPDMGRAAEMPAVAGALFRTPEVVAALSSATEPRRGHAKGTVPASAVEPMAGTRAAAHMESLKRIAEIERDEAADGSHHSPLPPGFKRMPDGSITIDD